MVRVCSAKAGIRFRGVLKWPKPVIQSSFNAGELSKNLWARTDLISIILVPRFCVTSSSIIEEVQAPVLECSSLPLAKPERQTLD